MAVVKRFPASEWWRVIRGGVLRPTEFGWRRGRGVQAVRAANARTAMTAIRTRGLVAPRPSSLSARARVEMVLRIVPIAKPMTNTRLIEVTTRRKTLPGVARICSVGSLIEPALIFVFRPFGLGGISLFFGGGRQGWVGRWGSELCLWRLRSGRVRRGICP